MLHYRLNRKRVHSELVPDPDFGEIVIPCWPYSGGSVDATGKWGEQVAENIRTVIGIYTIIWVAVFLFLVVHTFNYGIFQAMKFGLIGIIPLLAMTRGVTHICCDAQGLRLERRLPGFASRGREVSWHSLKEINLVKSKGGDPLRSTLCFREKNGRVTKLKLSKVATSENWKKLLGAIDAWSPVSPDNLDPDLFESLSVDRRDPTFTSLWLEALSAPPHRERLTPLSGGSRLDDGRYTLVERLGAGGQGTAYLARTEAGMQVVLKEYILPVFVEVQARKKAVERFQNEAVMLQKLNHPSIVKFLDSFIDDHRAYLVLEYIDGPSLKSLVQKEGPLPETRVAQLGLTMCDILSYLHSQSPPVVHRDFTPDNLILGSGGSLKLIDFMIAQQSDDTLTATVIGKHCYLSPEQFRGKAITKSDIYALGSTLYYLLTGSEPEPITCSHPILVRDEVSGEMDGIVARCTELDLDRRYLTAGEVRRDLERVLRNGSTEDVQYPDAPQEPNIV